ncbi:VWA domain-containing protein [uncultured Corynebacterium sp.]|uniref:vWA domain-containing protein n=1 Tax=uncultured Corynebacterium sp. TaxID=159447 RepID=UPI0025F562C4|nr:VWA domain-containing protein [uncultured Corynebacterium sp.]
MGDGAGAEGRRGRAKGVRGRDVRAVRGGRGVHVPGTVLAAAERGAGLDDGMVSLIGADVRGAERENRESNLIVFLVDASGSMAARDRLEAVTGAVQSLLRDAYQRRDRVAVVTFRGDGATVELPPTRSTVAASRRLTDVRTGGRTPLSAGVDKARELIEREHRRDPARRAMLVVLSDGRATSSGGREKARVAADLIRRRGLAGSIVVDCESGRVRLGLAKELAEHLGGQCLRIEELNADAVAGVVRAAVTA